MYYNMQHLYDTDFLEQLAHSQYKEFYVKINAYNKNGTMLDSIEGIVTNGSLNIDGSSSVRRSCSLTFVLSDTSEILPTDPYWSLYTQFQLYIGLKNYVDSNKYTDIIWFPMGWYLIASFNETIEGNKRVVNISGKDKMTKLNGEMGGVFTGLTTDLGKRKNLAGVEEYFSIQSILINLLTSFGEEEYYNILINDLDDELGLELLEYRGDEPLYLLYNTNTHHFDYYYTDPSIVCYKQDLTNSDIFIESSLSDSSIKYLQLNSTLISDQPTIVKLNSDATEEYTILRLTYGNLAGYKLINAEGLVYAGELIMNQGETVTGALDKIVTMLGNYEYFYNLDGQFVFQKRKNLSTITTPEYFLSTAIDGNSSLEFNMISSSDLSAFTFKNDELLISKATNYNFTNIKNDFVIWGKRNDIPIQMRYAIDKKPSYYKTYHYIPNEQDLVFNPSLRERESQEYTVEQYDWRELIYQMAYDYTNYHNKPDFYSQLLLNNPNLVSNYKTGYEHYYTDLLSFWRDVYNPNPPELYKEIPYQDISQITNDLAMKKIAPYNAEQIANLDKAKIYTLVSQIQGDDTAQYLARWIDTVDLSNLSDYSLNNMYISYQGKTIPLIDTLKSKFETEMVYIAKTDDETPQPLFDLLTDEQKAQVFLSTSTYGVKIKYQDYVYLSTVLKNPRDYASCGNNLYAIIKNVDANTIERYPIDNISITFPNNANEQVCIWKYDYSLDKLSIETLELITEAMGSYGARLTFYLQNKKTPYYITQIENIAVLAQRSITDKILWYKKDDATYEYLNNYFLHIKDNNANNDYPEEYNKYNVYFIPDLGQGFVKALDLLDIDKSLIYYSKLLSVDQDIDAQSYDVLLMDELIPDENLELYYWFDDQYMFVSGLNDDVTIPASIIIDNNMPKHTIEKVIFDIKGNISDIKDGEDGLRMRYYNRYYDYNYYPTMTSWLNCWHNKLIEDFNNTKYWIDFVSEDSFLLKYSVKNIGHRIKVEQDDYINGFIFNVPDIIYLTQNNEKVAQRTEYSTILMNEQQISTYFIISDQYKDMLSVLNTHLDALIQTNLTKSLTTIPVYWLDARQQVCLQDKNNYQQYYEIQRLTIPLAHNGKMSMELISLQ